MDSDESFDPSTSQSTEATQSDGCSSELLATMETSREELPYNSDDETAVTETPTDTEVVQDCIQEASLPTSRTAMLEANEGIQSTGNETIEMIEDEETRETSATNAGHQIPFLWARVKDRPRLYTSILKKYGVLKYDCSPTFTWESVFHNNPIQNGHLVSFIMSVGFFKDKRLLYKVDRNVKYANFKCCSCDTFKLHFKLSNEDLWFFSSDRSTPTHDKQICFETDEIPKMASGKKDASLILENSQELLDYLEDKLFQSDKDPLITEAQINSHLLNNCKIKHSISAPTLSRLKKRFKINFIADQNDLYSALPSYLRTFYGKNPSACVVVQADAKATFCRCFVAIPNAALIFRHLCLPVLHIDGAFYRIPLYDGVVILITAKNANGAMLLLGAAWVPNENSINFCWILELLHLSGFNFDTFPIMTDRGHLLSAATMMKHARPDLCISLKYCTEHIIRNVQYRFSIKNAEAKALRAYVGQLQSAFTVGRYISTINNLLNRFPEKGNKIALYLMRIHPRHWTVFGNRNKISDNQWVPDYLTLMARLALELELTPDYDGQDPNEFAKGLLYASKVPLGEKYPLMGAARNNLAESAANVLKESGVRSHVPPVAVHLFLNKALDMLKAYQVELTAVDTTQFPYTNLGLRLWTDAKAGSRPTPGVTF